MKNSHKGTWLMTTGLLLVVAALLLTGYNLWDEERANKAVQEILSQMPVKELPLIPQESITDSEEIEIPDYILKPEMEMPTSEIDGNAYIGTLEIPSLGLSLPIMSEWSYAKLKISPCRYSGSVYLDNIVIAGHSYRKHFKSLNSLELGAKLIFTDMDGNEFHYTVEATEVLKPTDVEEMTGGDWDMTLFTCTFDSRSRFALRCERINGER